jgi:hypothetical protein
MTRDDDYIGSVAYDCGYRAGQAHAAGLREALEFYADPEMWTPHKDARAPIELDAGKIARAAIAAAKGA